MSKVTNQKDSESVGAVEGICVRGDSHVGTVISTKAQKTAKVEWTRRIKLPKYERYVNKRTKVNVHNPESINAQEGDVVRIMACRPLSKIKNFVIVEKLGTQKGFQTMMENREEAKVKTAPKKADEKVAEEVMEEISEAANESADDSGEAVERDAQDDVQEDDQSEVEESSDEESEEASEDGPAEDVEEKVEE